MKRLGRIVRGVGRWVAFVLALVVLGVVLLLAGLQTQTGRDWALAATLPHLRTILPGLSVGRIEGNLLSEIVIVDAVLRDRLGGAAIAVGSIRIVYQPLMLLRRTVFVERLEIVDAVVRMERVEGGALNLAQLVAPAADEPAPAAPDEAPGEGAAWLIVGQDVRLQNGSFTVVLDDGQTLAVSGLAVLGRATIGRDFSVSLHRLAAEVRLPDGEALAVVLAGDGVYTAGDTVLAQFQAEILRQADQARLGAQIVARGPIDALEVGLRAQIPGDGQVNAQATLGLSDRLTYAGSITLETGDVQALDHRLPPGKISLVLALDGTGIPLSPGGQSVMRLNLKDTTIGDIRLDQLTAQAKTSADHWVLERATARRGENTLRMHGEGTLASFTGQVTVAAARLDQVYRPAGGEALVKGALELHAAVAGDMSGALQAHVDLEARDLVAEGVVVGALKAQGEATGTWAAPRGALRATMTNLRLQQQEIDRLKMAIEGGREHAHITLSATGKQLGAQLEAQVSWIGQRVTAELQVLGVHWQRYAASLARPFTVSADLGGAQIDVTPVELDVRGPELRGHLVARAAIAGDTLSGQLSALRVSWREETLALEKPVDISYGRRLGALTMTPLALTLAGGSVRVQGRYAPSGAQAVEAQLAVADLPLRLLALVDERWALAGHLAGVVRLDGSARDPRVDASLAVDGLSLADLGPIWPEAPPMKGRVSVTAQYAGTLSEGDGTVGVVLSDATVRELQVKQASAQVTLHAGPKQSAFEIILAAEDQRLLTGKADVAANLQTLLSARRDQAKLRAELEVPAVRLGPLLGQMERLGTPEGTLSAKLYAQGRLTQPEVEGLVELHDGRLGGQAMGQWTLRVHYADPVGKAELALVQPAVGQIAATATVDTRRQYLMQSTLHGEDLNIGFLQPLAGLRRLAGRVTVALEAEGPLSAPQVSGTLQLRQGAFGARQTPDLTGIRLDARLEPERLVIDPYVAESDRGHVQGRLDVALSDLRPQAFELSADFSTFRVGVPPLSRATFSGPLTVRGKLTEQNRLIASVVFGESTLHLPDIERTTHLHATDRMLPDVVFVDPAGKAEAASDEVWGDGPPLTLTLDVQADPLFVRSESFNVETASTLQIVIDDKGQPLIRGQATLRRGRIDILGSAFAVRHARVNFNGVSPPNPALDVLLERQYPEAMLYVGLQGTAEQPELVLSSDSGSYDRAQLFNLLLTGRLDARDTGGGDATATVTAAVSQAVLGNLARQLAPRVGLDVARVSVGEVEHGPTRETAIQTTTELGKYVTQRIYVGFRRVFGARENENSSEGVFEYRISPHWFLMTVFGDAGVGSVDLLWTKRY